MKIKDIIGRYLPFVWWVLLAFLSVAGVVAGAMLIGADMPTGRFFGGCTIFGSIVSLIVYAIQAWGEWIGRNNY